LPVPLTSDLTGGEIPTRILLEAAEGLLLTDSLALWDNISAIRQICLEPSPYGAISPQSLQRIPQGIKIAIAIF
jgi:mRNA interferase MazF